MTSPDSQNPLKENATVRTQHGRAEHMVVSVAICIQDDADILATAAAEILSVLDQHYLYYELLVIDNGSADESIEIIRGLQNQHPNIRLLVLSRPYDREIAITAALDNSIGDIVVLMNIEHDPPTLIPSLVQAAENGADIVIAQRKDREGESFFYRLFVKLFYHLYSRVTGFQILSAASDFRLFTRRAVNSITRIKSKGRYSKHIHAHVGFRQIYIPYERVYRRAERRSHESFLGQISRATELFISNSLTPLRFATFLGMVASTLNLLFILYVFGVSLVKKQVAEGWVSTSLVNSTMFFFLFLILTVVSEYIARILVEAKDQPLYFVADEYASDIMSSAKKKINVVE